MGFLFIHHQFTINQCVVVPFRLFSVRREEGKAQPRHLKIVVIAVYLKESIGCLVPGMILASGEH